MLHLKEEATNWPTARAEDAESAGNHPGATDSLTGATTNWKTPHGLSATDRYGVTAGGGGEFAKQALAWQTPTTHWPTPDVPNGGRSLSAADTLRKGATARGKRQVGLENLAKIWPTPDAPSANGGGYRTHTASQGKGHQIALAEVAQAWPTPRSNDHKSGVTGALAKPNSRPLCEVACQRSVPVPTTRTAGAPSSAPIRKLNPLFVESLMGLPHGWTACERLETASFRSWLRTHTAAFARLSDASSVLASAPFVV